MTLIDTEIQQFARGANDEAFAPVGAIRRWHRADKRGAKRQTVRAMTSTNDIQTETGARVGVIKLGLDVHASSIVVVRQSGAQVTQPAQRFTPEQLPAFVRKQLMRAEAVHSCYEPGALGYLYISCESGGCPWRR